MSNTSHYDALCETYKNQEVILAKKQEELDQVLAKYRDRMERSTNNRSQREDKNRKVASKKLSLIENLQHSLNNCQESGQSWHEVKLKQTTIDASQKKINTIQNEHIDIVQDVAKDLKQLDVELQQVNVANKIEEHKDKTQSVKKLLEKRTEDMKQMPSFDPNATGYQTPMTKEQYMKKALPKNVYKINAEIAREKESLHTINAKILELEDAE